MTVIWILVTGVAIVMALSGALLWDSNRAQAKLQSKIQDLEDELQDLTEANNDPFARYEVAPVWPEFILSHRTWGVYRKSGTSLDNTVSTLIRVFDDSDEEFNHREAVELCDILNGK